MVSTCSTCSGGAKVGFVGNGGTLTFNGISVPSAGTYRVTLVYCSGDPRPAMVSANGGPPQALSFASTGSYNTTGTMTVLAAPERGEQHDPARRPDRVHPGLRPDHRGRRPGLTG